MSAPAEFEPSRNVMVRVGRDDLSFQCEACGANVFTAFAPLRYRCNGCGETYTASKTMASREGIT